MAKIRNKLMKELSKRENQYKLSVVDKYITKCLEEHLFDTACGCDKHELHGKCKGIWRLKTGDKDIVIIYTIEGESPNQYAQVLFVKTNKEYHNWLEQC